MTSLESVYNIPVILRVTFGLTTSKFSPHQVREAEVSRLLTQKNQALTLQADLESISYLESLYYDNFHFYSTILPFTRKKRAGEPWRLLFLFLKGKCEVLLSNCVDSKHREKEVGHLMPFFKNTITFFILAALTSLRLWTTVASSGKLE